MFYYILFGSVTKVMAADMRLSGCGIKYEIVPVPKPISSSCGVCIKTGDLEGVLRCLEGMRPEAVYDECFRRLL